MSRLMLLALPLFAAVASAALAGAAVVATPAQAEPVPWTTASSGGTTYAWCSASETCYTVDGAGNVDFTLDTNEDDCLDHANETAETTHRSIEAVSTDDLDGPGGGDVSLYEDSTAVEDHDASGELPETGEEAVRSGELVVERS